MSFELNITPGRECKIELKDNGDVELSGDLLSILNLARDIERTLPDKKAETKESKGQQKLKATLLSAGIVHLGPTANAKCTDPIIAAKHYANAGYYNGKVVCLDPKGLAYTKGKVYEFKNGCILNDTGLTFPLKNCRSFEEWQDFSSAEWLEIKE